MEPASPGMPFPLTRIFRWTASFGILRELAWFIPFASIGLIVLALTRPSPQFPAPARSHTVIDGNGAPVRIGQPFQGAVMTWGPGFYTDAFLEATVAPEALARAGTARERGDFAKRIWSRIFPQVLKQDSLWDSGIMTYQKGPDAGVEGLLALDAGVFFGNRHGPARLTRQIGIPTLLFSTQGNGNWDDFLRAAARMVAEVSGHPERAEALIEQNRQAYRELAAELGAVPEARQPCVLIMGTSSPYYVKSFNNDYQYYLPPAQVRNATVGLTGQRQDAERILAMDPDFIFLMAGGGASPQEFMANPLWRGLKAVRAKRVYRMLGARGGGLLGLTYQPISVRWMAEITHPDRLQPKVRELLRDAYVSRFGYSMSDAEIDADLHLDANLGSAGYGRFARDAFSVHKQSAPQ